MAAGILACRRGRHLAARKKRSHGETIGFKNDSPGGGTIPPGWKPRLYVSQDGRRYLFQTASKGVASCGRLSAGVNASAKFSQRSSSIRVLPSRLRRSVRSGPQFGQQFSRFGLAHFHRHRLFRCLLSMSQRRLFSPLSPNPSVSFNLSQRGRSKRSANGLAIDLASCVICFCNSAMQQFWNPRKRSPFAVCRQSAVASCLRGVLCSCRCRFL
jgi:hypothetical protein